MFIHGLTSTRVYECNCIWSTGWIIIPQKYGIWLIMPWCKPNYVSKIEIGPLPIPCPTYRQVSNISRTLVGNIIVDNSDVVGAAPTVTSSLSTKHLALLDLGHDNCKTRLETFNFYGMLPWASCQIRIIAVCACAGNAGNVFPAAAG